MKDPIVETTRGPVQGVWRAGSAAFLGVPFAAPPVADRRFEAPQPHPQWSGVRDARHYGATPQRRPFGPVATIPEPSIAGDSTLNVNVFTPAPADSDARLPVLVWIHGGGYFAGSPASPWYDGMAFNRDGVVTVSVSYRLGFDGFGWIEDAPANRGVLDQIAALQWVQENIEAFGGDPARVTIAGQSAGGSAVLTLLTTPSSQRLFAHAIAESGVIRHRPLAAARELGIRFATRMGVDATRAGWSTLSEDQILDGQAELYAHPDVEGSADSRAVALVRAMAGGEPGDNLPFVPHVDDTLIPRGAPEMISEGVGSDKPLLLGANAHEFTMVMNGLRDPLSGQDPVTLLSAAGLDAETAKGFRGQFPDFDAGQVLGQLITERMFRIPLLDVVAARTDPTAAGTWLYDFRWVSPVMDLAFHCAELPFVWGLLNAEGVREVLGAEPPQELADTMHRAWVRFIDNGDPGWVRAAGSTGPAMVFDSASQVQDAPYLLEAKLAGQA